MAEVTVKPEAPVEVATTPPPAVQVVVPEAEKASTPAPAEEELEPKKIDSQLSFKEETNDVNELPESQKKALEEFKKLIQEALQKHELSSDPLPPPPPPAKEEEKKETPKTEETPKIEETPKTEETPKIEETPKTEEVPKPNETLKIEETPKTKETPKTETALKVEETPKTKEAVKTEGTSKTEENPKTVEAPKTITLQEEKTVEAIKETIVEVVAPEAVEETAVEVAVEPEEVSIWGIPLLADERSDVVLLKFLRARDFKVKEALTMLKNTVRWRKEIGVDALLEEDLGNDYEKVVFTHGHDKQGRPVCYNVFGEFQNKELYQNTFSDAEKRKKFLTWLIQFLEKTIRTLDFSPKGINSFVLVNDVKNSPGYGKRDLHKVVDKFLEILQDNYPEFVFKQVCTNVSWWYLAYNWIYLTVISPRSKSKFVFASPSKTPDTLFKYISPEQVPIQFGGLSKDGDHEFSSSDCLTEITIKPGTKHPIEFPLTEAPAELIWELRVIGWEVNYGAEYLPEKEGAYSLNIAKPKKLTATDEPLLCDSFKATETGKVVITIDNQTSKKKKLLYRFKIKASV